MRLPWVRAWRWIATARKRGLRFAEKEVLYDFVLEVRECES